MSLRVVLLSALLAAAAGWLIYSVEIESRRSVLPSIVVLSLMLVVIAVTYRPSRME